jgi:hypothetical protein
VKREMKEIFSRFTTKRNTQAFPWSVNYTCSKVVRGVVIVFIAETADFKISDLKISEVETFKVRVPACFDFSTFYLAGPRIIGIAFLISRMSRLLVLSFPPSSIFSTFCLDAKGGAQKSRAHPTAPRVGPPAHSTTLIS